MIRYLGIYVPVDPFRTQCYSSLCIILCTSVLFTAPRRFLCGETTSTSVRKFGSTTNSARALLRSCFQGHFFMLGD
jgi:hypothetical protein